MTIIHYFVDRIKIPRYFLVHMGNKDYEYGVLLLRVLPFHKFVE